MKDLADYIKAFKSNYLLSMNRQPKVRFFLALGVSQTSLNEGINPCYTKTPEPHFFSRLSCLVTLGIGSFYDHTSSLNTVNEKNKQSALLLDQFRMTLVRCL